MKATGGLAASRERRAQLVQGKGGMNAGDAMQEGAALNATGGNAASRERRTQLVQGKGVREAVIVPTHAPAAPDAAAPATAPGRAPVVSAHSRITGTLFSSDEPASTGDSGAGNHVTGDTPRNVARVTGTQRGAERHITGTSYYCTGTGGKMEPNSIERVANAFSVRSPQLDAQLRADAAAIRQPSAEGRITGTFARGEGKITGNQEFHYSPRQSAPHGASTKLTGEGRSEGPDITGGAWDVKSNVTGTEDYIAAERNPSERAGQRHGFASAGAFKGKGKHSAPTHHVTGMVGWSSKAAARVTVSGGAQG